MTSTDDNHDLVDLPSGSAVGDRQARAGAMDENGATNQPSRRHPVTDWPIVGLVVLVVLVSVIAVAVRNVRNGISAGEWATSGFLAVFFAVVVIVVFVSRQEVRHPWADRLANVGAKVSSTAISAYFALLVVCLYGVVLLAGFTPALNRWVIERVPVVQLLVVVGLGGMAALFLRRLLDRDARLEYMQRLVDPRFGVVSAIAFLVLAASVAMTASSALLLIGADHRWWVLLAPDGGESGPEVVDIDGLANEALTSKLVLWEMLDLAPIVKVPRTLGWEQPLTYEDWGPGLVLLAFKGVAGVALLAAGHALFDAWGGRKDRRPRRATSAADDAG